MPQTTTSSASRDRAFFRPLPLVLALQAVLCPAAWAANFTVGAGAPDTVGKTITSNDTGTVAAGGTLAVGAGTQAVTVTGTTGTVTLNNDGTISQTGTARAIRNNTSGVIFVLNNGANGLITAIGDDVLKVGGAASVFRLTNLGTIWQAGTGTASGQALDLRDITSTGNFVVNGSASNRNAVIRADGDDALRPGANMTITNYGTIISNGLVNTKCPDYLGALCSGKPSAHDAIDIGGNTGVVVENYGSISGPRHGITADTSVTVTNYAGGEIIGRNGSGVGSDGTATVTNYGLISGRYAGAGQVYDHLGNGGTVTDPLLTTTSNGDGDGVDIDGIGTVINYGRIEGLGGGGLDSGGRPNGGDGLALGGGTVTNLAGAVIYGKSNGILVDDGANGTDTSNLVANKNRGTSTAAASGVIINNAGEITGADKVAIGLVGDWNDAITNSATGVITGGALTQQVDKLPGDPTQTPGAAIQMGAGNDTLTNYGRIEGKNGLAIDMGAGDDLVRLFGGTVIGTINGGSGANTLETDGVQTFQAGVLSNFQTFNVRGGATTFNYGLGTVSAVNVVAGASLQVNGALATTGNLTVNGTLKAASGTGTQTVAVGGNYAQGASGVVEARLGAGNAADKIAVSGSATLVSGASFRPVASGYVGNGSRYTLLSAAGGIVATPASLLVQGGNTLVSYSLAQSGNDLVLTATRQNTYASLAPAGLASFGAALENLGASGNASAAPLLQLLENLPSASAVQQAVGQLAPESNGASRQASRLTSDAVLSAVDSRMDAARSGTAGVSALTDASGDRRIWAQALGAWGEQDSNGGVPGFKVDTQGIASGLETSRSDRGVMGLSLGYAQARAEGQGTGQGDDVRVKALSVGGYYSQNTQDLTLDASVAVGNNRYKSQRRVTVGTLSDTLQGDYKGWQLDGRVEAGLPFAVNGSWSGRWLAGARVGYLSTKGYRESGNAALALAMDGQDSWSVQSVLGAELSHASGSNGLLRLRARYLHEFADTAGSQGASAAFASGGPGFSVDGAGAGRDALQLGVSYRHTVSPGMTLSVGYDAQLVRRYVAHLVTARAAWAF